MLECCGATKHLDVQLAGWIRPAEPRGHPMLEVVFVAVLAALAGGNVAAQVVMSTLYPNGLPPRLRMAD